VHLLPTGHKENAEPDRGKTCEDQQPLPFDLLSQADRNHDLACSDRPNCNVEQDRQRGQTGGKESQDPDADSKQAPRDLAGSFLFDISPLDSASPCSPVQLLESGIDVA